MWIISFGLSGNTPVRGKRCLCVIVDPNNADYVYVDVSINAAIGLD